MALSYWTTSSRSRCQSALPCSRQSHLHVRTARLVIASATGAEKQPKKQSSWDAKEAGNSDPEADYLYALGKSDINLNIDTGQNSQNIDSVFTGTFLGQKSDIADGTLRRWDFRSFDHIIGDYFIPPKFLEKVAVHMSKNYMVETGTLPASTKVPLILGIWGQKGMGKTFQLDLAFKKLGVEPIVMSSGELENEVAGAPARLIRDRYRTAAMMAKSRGKMTALVIHDIDAGLGHFANTQTTVNNQTVIGTLMNLCDDPNRVSNGDDWLEHEVLQRVPIIVTGNDFTTMFAPLVRDGRMDKFYWEPTEDDIITIIYQMYKDDGISREDVEFLRARFPKQPVDFFGAIRSSTYDKDIRGWMQSEVFGGKQVTDKEAQTKALGSTLMKKELLPKFGSAKLEVDMLIEEGERLENEQEQIKNNKLSVEYFKLVKESATKKKLIGLQGSE